VPLAARQADDIEPPFQHLHVGGGRKIAFVRHDQYREVAVALAGDDLVQLRLRLFEAFVVRGVDDEDEAVDGLHVVAPQRPDAVLPAGIADVQVVRLQP